MVSFECSKPQLKRKTIDFLVLKMTLCLTLPIESYCNIIFFYTDGVSVENLYSCLIRLMNTNLTLHDIVEIPYPIVEIR